MQIAVYYCTHLFDLQISYGSHVPEGNDSRGRLTLSNMSFQITCIFNKKPTRICYSDNNCKRIFGIHDNNNLNTCTGGRWLWRSMYVLLAVVNLWPGSVLIALTKRILLLPCKPNAMGLLEVTTTIVETNSLKWKL